MLCDLGREFRELTGLAHIDAEVLRIIAQHRRMFPAETDYYDRLAQLAGVTREEAKRVMLASCYVERNR